jgi:micrococcal nuclease
MQHKIFPFFILLLLTLSSASQKPEKQNEKLIYYTVTKVIDGDTFWINDGSVKGLKIRFIGIDAPESRNTGQKVKAYYGQESKEYLLRLIGGKRVRLEYDIGHLDRYGRTLAYVYLEDGTFVNAQLVKNGYAVVMTIAPNVKYAETFVKLAREAREKKKGLWGEKDLHTGT